MGWTNMGLTNFDVSLAKNNLLFICMIFLDLQLLHFNESHKQCDKALIKRRII